MAETPKFHNEALMPLTMGSPYRVPNYAYPNWRLGRYQNEDTADAAYKAEWAAGTAAQLGLVSQAIVRAGFGDFPVLLHSATANVVAGIVRNRPPGNSLTIVDVGAGPGGSALAIFEALPDEAKNRTTMILIDPSKDALESASDLMRTHGIKHQKVIGTDLETLLALGVNSVDILTGVASIHHHARIPFDRYKYVLRPEGFAVFADWHQDIWEHPARVLKFLQAFDWPLKTEGLANWINAYHQSLVDPDKGFNLTPETLMAREQITRFWIAYKEIADSADLGPNALWPLEGHRPVYQYESGMRLTGFDMISEDIRKLVSDGIITSNPHQILPDSSLLQVTVGQK